MSKRDELLALAERCEKASEGSRELDARIACVLDNRSIHVIVDGDVLGRNNRPPHDICIVGWAPSYTTSLDAAMTLVPPGHDWSLFSDNGAAMTLVPPGHDWSLFSDNGAAMAGCMPASEDGCDWTDVPGATPALAICAAALRAQAEMEG